MFPARKRPVPRQGTDSSRPGNKYWAARNTGSARNNSAFRWANETDNDDCWKEIMLALRDSHTHGGQQKDCRTLDELLIGDTERLKLLIKDYLYENPGVSRLAYLLYALRQSGHIVSCNYITFHRALQSIANKPLGGPDVPQRRYHELLADPKLLGSKGKKWQQAKAIIERWTVLFGKKDI